MNAVSTASVPKHRQCPKCRLTSVETEFYACKNSYCKPCTRAHMRDVRSRRKDVYRETDRWRDRSPERMAARRAYRKTPAGRAANDRSRRKAAALYPEKVAARLIVQIAIKGGIITKLACAECGAATTEAHHTDYYKPLDIVWLCREHHIEEHARIKEARK